MTLEQFRERLDALIVEAQAAGLLGGPSRFDVSEMLDAHAQDAIGDMED